MLREISELIGLSMYTQSGVYLGTVANVVIDVERGRVDGLYLAESNAALVEGGKPVSVPYRWIQSVGDIVILRYFPKKVTLRKAPGKAAPLIPQR